MTEEYIVRLRCKCPDKEFLKRYLESVFRGLMPDYITIEDIRKPLEISVIVPRDF